ncbi:MAG: hypothetical protein ACXW19_10555, partial [Thermoanaerobaculia bacterium]
MRVNVPPTLNRSEGTENEKDIADPLTERESCPALPSTFTGALTVEPAIVPLTGMTTVNLPISTH